MTERAKDDVYWQTVDKVNMLVQLGYIEESQFSSTLEKLLDINKADEGSCNSPNPKHNN